MSIILIEGYEDPEFSKYEDMFWNFTSDDWDYMIIGDKEYEVEHIAEKLYVCDYQIKQIGDRWVAVTYHS
jgi:hypothetical protein